MGRKKERDELLNDRIVILENDRFKEKYTAMCTAIGENPSEHIRNNLHAELELYEAAKQ